MAITEADGEAGARKLALATELRGVFLAWYDARFSWPVQDKVQPVLESFWTKSLAAAGLRHEPDHSRLAALVAGDTGEVVRFTTPRFTTDLDECPKPGGTVLTLEQGLGISVPGPRTLPPATFPTNSYVRPQLADPQSKLAVTVANTAADLFACARKANAEVPLVVFGVEGWFQRSAYMFEFFLYAHAKKVTP